MFFLLTHSMYDYSSYNSSKELSISKFDHNAVASRGVDLSLNLFIQRGWVGETPKWQQQKIHVLLQYVQLKGATPVTPSTSTSALPLKVQLILL